jgi:hypothetical protein
MTLKLSTSLRTFVVGGGSVKDALQGGKILIYSGAQPATADAAPTGVLLATITDASGAHTAEVQASATITLAGASGSVDNVTVGGIDVLDGIVPFNSSLAQTAIDLANALNNSASNPEYTASAAGAVVTIKAKRGTGAVANGLAVVGTGTTLTATSSGNLTGGVSVVNGLKFGAATGGVLPKLPAQTWSGVAGATGIAGWFRFVGPVADSGALDTTESDVRLDGAISTSGAQLNMSSTGVTSGATQTISSFPITLPTA